MSKHLILIAVLLASPMLVSAEEPVDRSFEIANSLLKRISVPEHVQQSLEEALQKITTNDQIPYFIDPAVAKSPEEIQELLSHKITLRKTGPVRTETLLNAILAQVELTYVIQSDHLLITNQGRRNMIAMIDQIPTLPDLSSLLQTSDSIEVRSLVTAQYKDRPISEILKDLSIRTGRSVIMGHLEAKIDPAISIEFRNVPLESAMVLLAEKVDLRAARSSNALMLVSAKRLNPPDIKLGVNLGCLNGSNGPMIVSLEEMSQIMKLLKSIAKPE